MRERGNRKALPAPDLVDWMVLVAWIGFWCLWFIGTITADQFLGTTFLALIVLSGRGCSCRED